MCYYLKTFYYNDPLFKSVDATYIVHLEGNGRYKDIEEQLSKYHPTKIVHVLFNKGYKNCNKTNIESPAKDLIDAYLYMFEHAKRYNTILALEDDFMFNENVSEHTDNIDEFVNRHTDFIYRIGCFPFIMVPYNYNNYIGLTGGTHSVLYSKSAREKTKSTNINDWDEHLNRTSINYIYYTPVCYQLFTDTDNQKDFVNVNIFARLLIEIIKIIQLDKHVEPGYSIAYSVSKMWVWLIILFIVFKIWSNKSR